MIEYYILLEYKRLTEEKAQLESNLSRLTYRKTAFRNRGGNISYCLKFYENNTLHEHSVSREEYLAFTAENAEYNDTLSRLRQIKADIAKLEPQIRKCETKVNAEYGRLTEEAKEKNKTFRISNYRNDALKLVSVRGDIVKSKSELIIADCLYFNNIYYEYESPDVIKGFHPDFYIKDNLRGIPIVWEHFGKMSDPSYAQEYVRKQKELAKHGFLQGYNLITTFEYYDSEDSTKSVIMDSNNAESVINSWFTPSSFSSSQR